MLFAACGGSARIEVGQAGSGGAAGSGSPDAGGAGGTAGTGTTPIPPILGPASGMQVLFEGEDNPASIAVDEHYVYWVSLDVLRRAPLDGAGAPVTLATGEYLRGMLPVGADVFFLQSAFGSGSLQRVPRDGGDAVRLTDAINPTDLAVAGDELFWVDAGTSPQTGRLVRTNLNGTSNTELATGLAAPRHITLHDGHLYFSGSEQSCSVGSGGSTCSGGGIHRVPVIGGAPEQLLDAVAVSNVVANANGLYWFASSPPRVMVAETGGAERELANVLNEGIGINGIATLRADTEALYWAADDTVLRLPFDSEQVTRLVSDLDGASDVAVRSDWVYVAESVGGRILRVAIDGSANAPLGPITGPCPTPLGTPAERALTPRPDADLELLALSLEPGNLTANPTTYERVVADITAIRTLQPELADIGVIGAENARTLTLSLTSQGAQALAAEQYTAWDCLNAAYGVTSIVPYDIFGDTWVSLELGGIYDTAQVAELYEQLPEVSGAEASVSVGDGPTLCAARDGNRYEYVVDRAGGDCPSGCTEHEAHHFESNAAGEVTAGGVWRSESGEAAPEWFGRVCR